MKAIEITEYGAPNVLKTVKRPIPDLKLGEVLIKVSAAGVNRPDVFQRMGNYLAPQGASDIPGLEISGKIISGTLNKVNNPFGLTHGQRVCALTQGGGYAEYASVPLAQCLPIPMGLSDIQAASLPETFFTVWSNVFDSGRLSIGKDGSREALLVQGGSSGIGITAIQMAHAFGHPVFATAGNAQKCAACEALGAKRGINYKTEDFVSVIKSLTYNRGVDVILDMVGGSYVERELNVLASGGRILLIALLGGSKAQIDLSRVLRRRLILTGSILRPRSVTFKAAIATKLYERVWPLIEQGAIKPVIHHVFPAEHADAAHTMMERGENIGKIILTW
ncbi:NAD(P)H-quinone oxidoreductase [Candidatus Vallotia tarda]|uniref:NAD(P)H-quinone oxidoreductase PIG3 family n=1 Tax=Candidatus Vallotiella hemipterorum TaxID=1177213 RepID=A0A916JV15_9BURK|nr:NAD(P)H-quinone oxidoreductase [Candidatus Vallotia tarda]CAG7601032.1 NAD(P)H-quinone oxidoreductase PIG3 family [Candidatus Vallotia tarda]